MILNFFLKKSTTGPNEIPYKIIHEIADVVLEPLKNIINQSLENGTFPEILKLTRYVPIPKRKVKFY